MTVERGLRALLIADATVSALVGTRIYPLEAPGEADLPLIVYRRIGSLPARSHDGAHPPEVRVQLSLYAAHYSELAEIEAAVRGALDGYRGALDDVSGLVLVDNSADDGPGGSDRALRRVVDVLVSVEGA